MSLNLQFRLIGLGLSLLAPSLSLAQSAPVPGPLMTPYAMKGPLEIRKVSLVSAEAVCFEKAELVVEIYATYDNPFDSSDVALEAHIRSGSGKSLSVPGFIYRPYQRALENGREVLKPAGDLSWRIRFTPSEPGPHEVTVCAKDRSGRVESEPIRLVAARSRSPGFIRVSPKDRRYFAFQNGQPYFAIGANVCWADGRGTFDYDEWFSRYAAAGCNYARLWLSPHWSTFALERPGKNSEGLGIGLFDFANAWRIDYVLELAEARGLYLMLCIDSFNILREKDGYPQWDSTPHNARQGGPLERPADFWTSPEMDRLYRDKLRYLVARYGYSPHVLSWEFWNEADITTGYRRSTARDWHARMAEALRALDPCDHLITTSFANTGGDPEIDALPGLDYVQTHHYNNPDLATTLAQAQAQKTRYGKPHIVGEIGADSGGPRTKDDPLGLQVHDPLWVTMVTGGAGTAQPWWWDNNIHPANLYPLFGAAARFAAGIDWPGEGFRSITPKFEPEASAIQAALLGWALAGKQTILVWARLEGRAWKRVCALKEHIPPAPASVLVLPEVPAGRWTSELWDTWTGAVRETKEIVVPDSGELRVGLPVVEKDVALKVRRAR